ncbi:hypothetical protein NLU13_6439 [Sarocladium strictum]|uniref:3-oxo-5-alpha-steroid 4-dehydrogenase C-terminal domain-containing protein n=1 Tax=Sarocladium strictum TaxID=5046 RepID=A0AA39GHG7_SARSR|nr:hypothetical protein NLU13_6439 [Sarocladium strictum]
MAALKELKLTPRVPKKPLKNLPSTIPVGPTTTVEDVKAAVAQAARIRDHHRIGVYDPTTRTTCKNRKELIANIPGIVPWRTVFVLEYLGPIVIHPIVLYALPYALEKVAGVSRQGYSYNATQTLSFYMIVGHFVKRELETLFVHRFSAATMPAANVLWNSAHYWIPAGLLAALEIYSPWGLAARPVIPAMNYVGLFLYFLGQLSNFRVHLYLKSLRKPGETERRLPSGHGFELVTCPNYMWEVVAWLGAIIVSKSIFIVIYMCIGTYYMYTWGVGKEKAYREQFGDRYKKKRYIMLPGFL